PGNDPRHVPACPRARRRHAHRRRASADGLGRQGADGGPRTGSATQLDIPPRPASSPQSLEDSCFMNPIYAIRDTSAVFSPALLFYKDLIRRNLARVVEIAGRPERLRPHVKTHKTREIVRMELDAGITKHKCATLAEAEMLAQCGVPDVLLAYH